jgi:hypothetical protein
MNIYCHLACHLAIATLLLTPAVGSPTATLIPPSEGTALDGHPVTLPRDLATHATILILGFSKNSADNTTAWEKAIRGNLASQPTIGYFDMPFLEDAPSLIRPLIVRSIRKQVPDVLKPYFVPLTSGEAAWKQLTNFTPTASDAAYVLLVDHAGQVRWQTHETFSPTRFNDLSTAARKLAAEAR